MSFPRQPAGAKEDPLKRDASKELKTILVVEDELPILGLIRLLLQSDGYAVLEATTGEQARQQFEKAEGLVDLLISDVRLPRSSGIHVALELRSQRPYLRIILTSGYPPSAWSDQDAAELNELPSDSVTTLEKPFSPFSLLDKVHRLIGPAVEVSTTEGATS